MAPKVNRTEPNKNKPKGKVAKQANEPKTKEETLFDCVKKYFAGYDAKSIVKGLKQIYNHKRHERYNELLPPVEGFIRHYQGLLHKPASRRRASLNASNSDLKLSREKHTHLQLLPDYDEPLFENIAEAVSKLPKQDQVNVPTMNNLATSGAGVQVNSSSALHVPGGIVNDTTCPGNYNTPDIFFGFGPGEPDVVLRRIAKWGERYKIGVFANSTDESVLDNFCSLLHNLHLGAYNSGAVSGNDDVVDDTASHDINLDCETVEMSRGGFNPDDYMSIIDY